ncbi:hypothetical protein [Aquamicrobium defluvii]|uniref:Uncharacterized protein n=1 Tax=Aquamicrobium defluvii TaxID=69279 RepID=A0A4V3DKQ8_9HYPH|nr:hypothetical protein [Aquamicrobium defluvii]TDR35687.1 hypothetical protein DES43_108112 [Aquamicrobium defluvii]
MTETGFYHPELGYWQAVGGEPEALLSTYPAGTVQVPIKPGADFEWQNSEWVYVAPPPPPAPDRVSSRQFKLQLLEAGLLDSVDAWIATQDRATQIAYANSGTFVRDDPMMQAGFAALGFTEQQVDDFYTAAAAR